jgi:hypothetical protein
MFAVWFSLVGWSLTPVEAPSSDPAGEEIVGGEIVFDVRLPAALFLDGVQVVQLSMAGRVMVDATPGTHELTVVTHGEPHTSEIFVTQGHITPVLVGRQGLVVPRTPQTVAEPDLAQPVNLELHATGDEPVLVLLNQERWLLAAGESRHIVLPQGEHGFSVRNGDGTIVWARGGLLVKGSEDVVMQIGAGRAPEVSGGAQLMSSVTP